jgi:glycosyltransferase involved in cell wall biosynthesis
MKLWLDVDDLFFFARHSSRLTGIQRLSGEVYKAFVSSTRDVGFVIHDERTRRFSVVEEAYVSDVYDRLTKTDPASACPETASDRGNHLNRLLRALGLTPKAPARSDTSLQYTPSGLVLDDVASPDDVLCSLGAPWHNPYYADQVSELCNSTGMKFIVLVHDLIPLLRPEYFDLGQAPHFERVMKQTLPLADGILTNSRHTAKDVVAWTESVGLRLRCTPTTLPIGTGFIRPAGGELPTGLEPGHFALFVSTIEVRKNHIQPFRIWTRLLREHPKHLIPKLVFAGRSGWMVDDLGKAIESTRHLDGHLTILNDVDDRTLAALYKGCKFTLFTSHYEGWGLPVSDSLAFGKVCVASNRTSIPEAGKSFCAYVDPDNTTDAYETVRALITTPQRLAELQERLARDFRHVPWTETADAVLAAATNLRQAGRNSKLVSANSS